MEVFGQKMMEVTNYSLQSEYGSAQLHIDITEELKVQDGENQLISEDLNIPMRK